MQLKEVPEPRARPGHLLVRTRTSLISAGTERMVVEFTKKGLVGKAKARPDLVKKVIEKARRDGIAATLRSVSARLDEPLPLGYSAAGIVEAVGPGVEGRFRVGQRVAIAGAGLANHAEFNVVPDSLAAPVPDDVNDEEACFGTLAAIALHAVRNLGLEFGDTAAVIGVGLVGQLAVQLLDLAGIRVIALDYDQGRLELARYGRAELAWNLSQGDPERTVREVTDGLGCDGVLIAAATSESTPFATAASIARDRARVCLVGHTGTELPYREFMAKELSVVVSRSYGPGRYDEDFEGRGIKYPPGFVRWTETRNLAEAVRRMSRRRDHRLAVEQFITHTFDLDDAEAAYRLVLEQTEPHLGVVLRYPREDGPRTARLRKPVHVSPAATGADRACVLGVIGAGHFARAVLLPLLAKQPDCRLHTIVARGGAGAEHGQDKFGFENASTDETSIFENGDINAVVIATSHAAHADLTRQALEAGKHVWIEKPLALDRDQLNAVIRARGRTDAFFQVGFNRRFAPMSVKAREHLAMAGGTKYVLLRVNAGGIDAGNWQNAPEEGHGRIIGEACHFVDLTRFLVGAPIAAVHAAAARVRDGACDDATITLDFTDGSLATIAYTALGDTAYSKELIEGYAGGRVVTIDDFRSYATVADGRVEHSSKGRAQDKGHAAALRAFVAAVAAGGPAPVDEAELIETSLATIAIRESLQTGTTVSL
jgi:predicted dehydrogenase/threonine dehydrogenase-like Zn-dependent dehydrogenase